MSEWVFFCRFLIAAKTFFVPKVFESFEFFKFQNHSFVWISVPCYYKHINHLGSISFKNINERIIIYAVRLPSEKKTYYKQGNNLKKRKWKFEKFIVLIWQTGTGFFLFLWTIYLYLLYILSTINLNIDMSLKENIYTQVSKLSEKGISWTALMSS